MVLNPMTRHTLPSLLVAGAALLTASAAAVDPARPAPTAAPVAPVAPVAPTGLVAWRVGRAETVANGTIEHAVILVEDGKILAIGEDLPIERGVRIVDRPDWTVMPGLVNCYSRVGMDSEAGGGFNPSAEAVAELFPRQEIWRELLELGVTTLGLYPPGKDIP
ncbi:MAG: hypothetical protein KDB60_20250, partial [Propionibacteriaceae bacterium]|nr:hypothetical protein [Propionibacteriaceae bacterium]